MKWQAAGSQHPTLATDVGMTPLLVDSHVWAAMTLKHNRVNDVFSERRLRSESRS